MEWREPVNGMAEIAGVPEAALQAFSQRRAQVLDYLERRGSSGFYAAKVAAIETRDRKEPVDLPRHAAGVGGARGRAWPRPHAS